MRGNLSLVQNTITYPKKFSEFEVHATLYSNLKACLKISPKYEVRGEVRFKSNSIKARFDLVIFKNKSAICIIEVKDTKPEVFNTNTRQFRKYSSFNLPLIYCFTMDDVERVTQQVLEETIFLD